MSARDIVVDRVDGVRTVTLDRPAKRNALTPAMLSDLSAAFAAAPAPDELIVVLRAKGPVFCAGLDLTHRLSGDTPAGESPIEEALSAVEACPLPVVAIVQGDAIAGGNELALHCDFVVAAESARFGMSLAQIGLAPTWYLARKLVSVGGPVLAREMLLLGDPIPATRLAELGVIARAVPSDRLEEAAASIIDRLVANAPLSLRAIKATIVRATQSGDDGPHGDLDELIDAARNSQDAREGMAARLERRTAHFEGR